MTIRARPVWVRARARTALQSAAGENSSNAHGCLTVQTCVSSAGHSALVLRSVPRDLGFQEPVLMKHGTGFGARMRAWHRTPWSREARVVLASFKCRAHRIGGATTRARGALAWPPQRWQLQRRLQRPGLPDHTTQTRSASAPRSRRNPKQRSRVIFQRHRGTRSRFASTGPSRAQFTAPGLTWRPN